MDFSNVHQKYYYLESLGLLLTLRVKTLLQFPPDASLHLSLLL